MNTDKLRKIIREEIKMILSEERGLTKQFDKTITLYRELSKQVQDEILRFKREFPQAKDKELYKKNYINKMKPLQQKFKDAEFAYNRAIINLPTPDEDELM